MPMAQVMSYGASDFFGLGLGHNHSQRFEPSDRFRAGGLPPRGYYYPQQRYDRQAGYRHGGGVNKKRSKRDRQQQNGAPGHVNRTRRDNARAARQYSIQGTVPDISQELALSLPRAPPHNALETFQGDPSPAVHAPGFHTQTPNPFSTSQEYWKNSYSTVDKEAAGLVGANANFDFYGSNTGLISRAQMGSDDDEDEFSDGDGVGRGPSSSVQYALQMDVDTANTLARAKVEEQAVYIAELEEENLNLKERMFLLEQQLRESRQGQVQAAQQTGSSENSASESDQCEQEEPQAEEEEEEGAIL